MKYLYFLLAIVCNFSIAFSQPTANRPFITTWQTDNPGASNDNQITIPTVGGTGYNYTVNWGDGNTDTNVTNDITHTYATPGIYTVSIIGDFPRIFFNGTGDNEKILTIEQWGTIEWESMSSSFSGCINLQGNFIDRPDLSRVTTMQAMFSGAINFDHPIQDWDLSNVTDMINMFRNARSFNQDIRNWDVSNVTIMQGVFQDAVSFNRDISIWDVSNTTTMVSMFSGATTFNQDISNWNISNVITLEAMFSEAIAFNQDIGDWNTSNVTTMRSMFARATEFNQDIGRWNVSNVTNMGFMFSNAVNFNQDIGNWETTNVIDMTGMFVTTSAFNQNIGNWNVENVTNMRIMFSNAGVFDQDVGNWDVSSLTNAEDMFQNATLSVTNYDALLIGWNERNLQPNVPFSGGNSQYCEGEAARTNMIDSDGWIITDGGSIAPRIIDLSDQEVVENFTFPIINGTNLTGNERYYTAPNGNGISYNPGDIINFNAFTSYPVTIYIFDVSIIAPNCFGEQDFLLTINTLDNLIIPNFFTPNSDGTNDTWRIIDPDNSIGGVFIFNKLGQLISQINSNTNGWNGLFNGRPLPSTDYWYRIIFRDGRDLTGHFSLKR